MFTNLAVPKASGSYFKRWMSDVYGDKFKWEVASENNNDMY